MFGGKKNSISRFLSLCVICAAAMSCHAVRMERVAGVPWCFAISNNEAVLVGSLASEIGDARDIREELAIPGMLAGLKVAAIKYDAFVRSMYWHGGTRDRVRRIKIPSCVGAIDPRCFSYFLNLQGIDVDPSNRVYKSEDGILYRRGSAEAICIPHGRKPPEQIRCDGNTLYRWPRNATGKLHVPPTIKCIGARAFAHCKNVVGVELPLGVETIGEYAFGMCLRLEEMVFPVSVTNVGDGGSGNVRG